MSAAAVGPEPSADLFPPRSLEPDLVAAGRQLFGREAQFVAGAAEPAALPPENLPEIAFAGRSNVGKSSLVNALTGRHMLARTSNTPGRTQELIFFSNGDSGAGRPVVVDMPGYGYAAAAKTKISAWTRLIHDYLRGRATLARVYLLIDSRHGLMAADEKILQTLDEAAVSYQIVLTKCDRITAPALAERLSSVQAQLKRRPAAFPIVLTTSAQTGAGIPELRAAICRLLHERG